MSRVGTSIIKRRSWLPAEIALFCLVTVFLGLRLFALIPHPADEGIYFYGALRWSQGLWPYRDFFHAHPPLHLLPAALAFRVFGFSLFLAKLPTFLSATFLGVAAYVVTVRVAPVDGPLVRKISGLMAAAVLLFAEGLLKAAATDTGICQASAWIGMAAMLLTLRCPALAGMAAAAAPLTLLQAGPAAFVVVVASTLLGKRAALRCVVTSVIFFLATHLACWAAVGKAFWQQVYGFHLDKIGSDGEGALQLGFVVFDNWTLFTLAVVGALALLMGPHLARNFAILGLAAATLTLVAIATRPRVFPFYFQPAFFPLALLVGWGFARILDEAVAWWRRRRETLLPPKTLWVSALALLVLAGPLARPLMNALSPKRAAQLTTYAQTYSWVDAPGLGPANAMVRALFWQDGVRLVGQDANAITQYLWQRSRWMDVQPAMVDAVAQYGSRNVNTTVFGDSTVAPLVALQAGVPIAADLVDTNMQRVRTGNLPISEILALLERTPDALVLLGQNGGIGALPELRAFVSQRYEMVGDFQSQYGYRYFLWRRRSSGRRAPEPHGPQRGTRYKPRQQDASNRRR